MSMRKEELRQRIEQLVSELAKTKYDLPYEQVYYMIGFLTEQLADACWNDSQVYAKFKHTIDNASNTSSKNAARAQRNDIK